MSKSVRKIPGLAITSERLDEITERNIVLLRRGLELHEKFCDAAEVQETERERAEQAAEAQGKTLPFSATDEEKAWDAFHDRGLTSIAVDNRHVLEQLGLDPRRSALFKSFPELLQKACDPQVPVLYDPSIRRFALKETWGPAMRVISHCPWSGRKLPPDLADDWFDLMDELMGTEDWTTADARNRLDAAYFCEEWWIARGL
ncbi:hypothetical protein [uncultured Roseibium sp.]|uniref:DUF6980 family protein n=1 Tax=uncultured Roseibium sp. TaxID=1936171 RepID=UPI002635FB0B|nr:hypothetical protein [uncultured Roseibium sp.]